VVVVGDFNNLDTLNEDILACVESEAGISPLYSYSVEKGNKKSYFVTIQLDSISDIDFATLLDSRDDIEVCILQNASVDEFDFVDEFPTSSGASTLPSLLKLLVC